MISLNPDHTYNTRWGILPSVTTILDATRPAEEAEKLAKVSEKRRNEGKSRGSEVDEAITHFYTHGRLPIPSPSAAPFLENLEPLIHAWRPAVQIIVAHPIGYAGTVDALGYWEGKQTVWDWKTSRMKFKSEWLENYLLQVTAYAGALEPHIQIDQLAIAVASSYSTQLFLWDWPAVKPHTWPAWLRRVNAYKAIAAKLQ